LSTIKTVLKKIFPATLLKKIFLVYNSVRILTIDRLLFPEYKVLKTDFLLYRNGYPFREEGVLIDDLPENKVKEFMRHWYDWQQEEFILAFDQTCIIEPDHGWAIVRPNKLIYYSLGVSRTPFQPKPEFIKFLLPKNILQLTKVISLRDSGEENYFHFYNDVLTKIFFLQKHGINVQQYSIIISAKLFNKHYFKYFLEHSEFLSSLNWVVQDKQYILASSSVFCKPLTHRKDLWLELLQWYKPPAYKEQQRVFLTRSKTRLRFIENVHELESVLRRYRFKIVDADDLTFEQQISLFASASLISGIHGAGLSNMIYRNGACRVLEVFPPPDLGYLPFHYIMLASMKGFAYRAIIGDPSRSRLSGGFHVDPDEFERELRILIP
jgi:hypothetical protein